MGIDASVIGDMDDDGRLAAQELPARRLLEVGRSLLSDLDAQAILDRVLEAACDLTNARYAALGVLDEQRRGLAHFFTRGLSAEERRAIGDLPTGKGVLGALIDDPRPLRLSDVATHPLSYGIPSGHPPMHSFLGVPVTIRGEVWGNLYLTEKQGAPEFSDADEEAVLILVGWAGAAIERARVYERSEKRRIQLEQTVKGLEATRDIAATCGVATLEHTLELIAKRGRALVSARTFLVMVRDGESLAIVAKAGHLTGEAPPTLPIAASTCGQTLVRGRPRRISDVASEMQVPLTLLGVGTARTALLVPMLHAGQGVGVLAAFDRGRDSEPFTETDEGLMRSFAVASASAIASARMLRRPAPERLDVSPGPERGSWSPDGALGLRER